MTARFAEVTAIHTRLLRCTLEVENSRAWWAAAASDTDERVAHRAFEESWFGARSLPRVKLLVSNMRHRYDAYPHALHVLQQWRHMDPAARTLVCHWHVQLSDPLYRAFTGSLLVERHNAQRADITRDAVVRWVEAQSPGRWTIATRTQFASQILVTARAAGLVKATKDPRQLAFPKVPEEALTYLLYLLRGVTFEGTLLDNPYLASVGMLPSLAEDRLRAMSAFRFHRQGELVDFGWVFRDLEGWATAAIASGAA
ncbi:MAG: DUF1819 family protein [Deltaproteobacteria bacterium]|nr:DUF1819 family protein [Deltaproteobacteria bacterium]